MKKELLIQKPLLTGRLHIAYPMCSFMRHTDGEMFLYNYFINLECNKNNEFINLCYVSQLDFNNNSWIHHLNCHQLYIDFCKEKEMILIDSIIHEINTGNYVYLFLDEFYFEERKNNHNLHINLIYGYDSSEKTFLCVGYDKERKYKKMDILFSVIDQAFYNPVVEVFRPNSDRTFVFSKNDFTQQLEDYLCSKNTLISETALNYYSLSKDGFVYGESVYERLLCEVRSLKEKSNIDIRSIYQIYEHSMLNSKRLEFLRKNSIYDIPEEIIKFSHEIYLNATILKNVLFKYMLNRQMKNYNKLNDMILSQRELTHKLYIKLLSILK